MEESHHLQFLREKFGGRNWVLARRSRRIVRQYGDDVLCLSQKRYRAAELEYRALYGDPYDKVRAQMYRTLVQTLAAIKRGEIDSSIVVDLESAIDAEKNRP